MVMISVATYIPWLIIMLKLIKGHKSIEFSALWMMDRYNQNKRPVTTDSTLSCIILCTSSPWMIAATMNNVTQLLFLVQPRLRSVWSKRFVDNNIELCRPTVASSDPCPLERCSIVTSTKYSRSPQEYIWRAYSKGMRK